MPRRVQVAGDLFHGRVPDGAIYVGRAAPGLPGSRWANPFRVRKPTPATVLLGGQRLTLAVAGRTPPDAEAVVDWYRRLVDDSGLAGTIAAELAGQNLACWCKLPERGRADICHAVVLLDRARRGAP